MDVDKDTVTSRCTEAVFDRGQKYRRDGHIRQLDRFDDLVTFDGHPDRDDGAGSRDDEPRVADDRDRDADYPERPQRSESRNDHCDRGVPPETLCQYLSHATPYLCHTNKSLDERAYGFKYWIRFPARLGRMSRIRRLLFVSNRAVVA